MANLIFEKQAATTLLNQVYLQGDGIALDHWLRTASQLGICTFKIFKRIHRARFKVSPRIANLAQGRNVAVLALSVSTPTVISSELPLASRAGRRFGLSVGTNRFSNNL